MVRFLLFFFMRSRSCSSRSFGKTSGRTLSITLGRIGSRGFRSHDCVSAGLSRYMRHSRTEYLVILKYRRMGGMVTHEPSVSYDVEVEVEVGKQSDES